MNLGSTDKLINLNENKFDSAEKGLDLALNHIDKLKEDMNILCSDIDSLYKKQKLSNNFNTIENINEYDEYYLINSLNTIKYNSNNSLLCSENDNELIDWSMNDDMYDIISHNYTNNSNSLDKILNNKKDKNYIYYSNKLNKKKPNKYKSIICLHKKSLVTSYSLFSSLYSLHKLMLKKKFISGAQRKFKGISMGFIEKSKKLGSKNVNVKNKRLSLIK